MQLPTCVAVCVMIYRIKLNAIFRTDLYEGIVPSGLQYFYMEYFLEWPV